MNRIRELVRTPLLSIERFDHPEGDHHVDHGDEEASGFAINIIERGSFDVIAAGATWPATAGAVFCTAPAFVYRCEHPPGFAKDTCLTISFGAGTEDELFAAAKWPATQERPVLPATNRRGYAAARLTSRLGLAGLDIEAAALEMLAATVADADVPRPLYRASQRSWYAARIDRARERLDAEYVHDHSLSSLARDAGMSPFHFARIFAELVGLPPHRYLVRRRLDVAGSHLRAGSSVTEACFDSGFSSLSHFARTFKRRHGVVPSALRRQRSNSAR